MIAQKNIKIINEIFDFFTKKNQAPDVFLQKYYSRNRFIGSKERKLLSEFFYLFIRNRKLIEAIVEYAFPNNTQKIQNCIIVNFILATFNININSKLKEIYQKTKPKQSDFTQNYYFLKYFRDSTKKCQIKLTISTINSFVAQLKEDILDTNLDDAKRLQAISIFYSFDYGILKQLYEVKYHNINALVKFVDSANQEAKVSLRLSDSKQNFEIVSAELNKENVNFTRSNFTPNTIYLSKRINLPAFNFYKKGRAEIQDEGSQLISYALNPSNHSSILDSCAGAGGKSLHISDLTNGTAEITACDIGKNKLIELEKRAKRHQLKNITTYLIDTKKHNDFLKAKHFDYVLIDAPCSGFGTIRRNPDKKYSLSIDIIKEFQKQQKEILKYYSQFLKNGGHLIYATCSILQLENEDILEDFLSKNPDFKPNPFKSSFDKYKLQIPIKEDTYHLTIFPEDFETDGFFIASLVRRSD